MNMCREKMKINKKMEIYDKNLRLLEIRFYQHPNNLRK